MRMSGARRDGDDGTAAEIDRKSQPIDLLLSADAETRTRHYGSWSLRAASGGAVTKTWQWHRYAAAGMRWPVCTARAGACMHACMAAAFSQITLEVAGIRIQECMHARADAVAGSGAEGASSVLAGGTWWARARPRWPRASDTAAVAQIQRGPAKRQKPPPFLESHVCTVSLWLIFLRVSARSTGSSLEAGKCMLL